MDSEGRRFFYATLFLWIVWLLAGACAVGLTVTGH